MNTNTADRFKVLGDYRTSSLIVAASNIRIALKRSDSWPQIAERGRDALAIGSAAIRSSIAYQLKASARARRVALLDSTLADTLIYRSKSPEGQKLLNRANRELQKRSPATAEQRIEATLARLPSRLPEKLVESIRENYLAFLAESSLMLEDSLTKLAQGNRDKVNLLNVLQSKRLDLRVTNSPIYVPAALACITRGLLALIHSKVNHARVPRENSLVSGRPEVLERLYSRKLEEFTDSLRNGQKELYAQILGGEEFKSTSQSALSFSTSIEAAIGELAEVHIDALKMMEKARTESNFTRAQTFGRIALSASTLTREAVASYIAACRIAVDVVSPQPDREIESLIKSASFLPFDSALPDGKNLAWDDLEKTTENALVEVEGFVESVEATMGKGNFLSSKLRIIELERKKSVNGAVAFLHLPHAGVISGSYCKLHGHWKSSSKLLDGEPGIEIDRVQMDETSKRAWRHAFIRLSNPWFEYLRNGNHMFWTIGPHQWSRSSGGDEGAGELIYPPLVRE